LLKVHYIIRLISRCVIRLSIKSTIKELLINIIWIKLFKCISLSINSSKSNPEREKLRERERYIYIYIYLLYIYSIYILIISLLYIIYI